VATPGEQSFVGEPAVASRPVGAVGRLGSLLAMPPESAYDYFDEVLVSIVQNASLDEVFSALAEGLRHPPFGGESYFLTRAPDDRTVKRSPAVAGVPGPPFPGPWDGIWEGATSVEHENLSRLTSALRDEALRSGYSSVACFAVHPGPDGRTGVCLVVWSPEPGRLSPVARLAIERAVVIASLAISHRFEEEGLTDAVLRDQLTGLLNRRTFFEAIEARVQAGEQPAVMYIDLDGFKAVNDKLGHLAGDTVLRVAARRLASVMRPTDELARLDGDQFAVLCNGSPSAYQMVMIAERVVEQMALPLSVGDGQTVHIGASVGIALELGVGTPVDTILGRADRALSEAKEKGKGRWVLASVPE
jgi:diguanylate cyclase (GGDEF)-like protein